MLLLWLSYWVEKRKVDDFSQACRVDVSVCVCVCVTYKEKNATTDCAFYLWSANQTLFSGFFNHRSK